MLGARMLQAAAGGTASYDDMVLADSPSLYWRMDAASGVKDAVGSNDGSCGSGVLFHQPPLVGSYSVYVPADSTGYVASPVSGYSAVTPSGDWSIEIWMSRNGAWAAPYPKLLWKPVAPTHGQATYLFQGDTGSNGVVLRTTISGTNYTTSPSGAITDGIAHHLVGVRSGANLLLYVDGALSQSMSIPAGPSDVSTSYGVTIGYTGHTNDYLGANVDGAAVYLHALSSQRIAEHYAAGTA